MYVRATTTDFAFLLVQWRLLHQASSREGGDQITRRSPVARAQRKRQATTQGLCTPQSLPRQGVRSNSLDRWRHPYQGGGVWHHERGLCNGRHVGGAFHQRHCAFRRHPCQCCGIDASRRSGRGGARVEVRELHGAIKEGRLNEAFGLGTAATISPICTLGLEDGDWDLPSQDTWTVAPRLKQRLDEVRIGAGGPLRGTFPSDSCTLDHGSLLISSVVFVLLHVCCRGSNGTCPHPRCGHAFCVEFDYRALGHNPALMTFDGCKGGYTRTTGGFEGACPFVRRFWNAPTSGPN